MKPNSTVRRARGGILGLLAGVLTAGSVWAQQAALDTPEPDGIDGRTFAQVNLPATPQNYSLAMKADRAWTWREESTERLVLERNVVVTVGPYSFRARRATVWLEPIRLAGRDAEQIAVDLEGVFDPSSSAELNLQAEQLLVTAILYRTEPELSTYVRFETRPETDSLRVAEERFAEFLRGVTEGATGAFPAGEEPDRGGTGPRAASVPTRLGDLPEWARTDDRGPMPPAERSPALLPRRGLVTFYSPRIEIVESAPPAPADGAEPPADQSERALILSGGASVQYTSVTDPAQRAVQLSADRAVVFLGADADPTASAAATENVRGVYLEGNVVASTGEYTLRGRRVYYDPAADRAIVLDAVFWTYDEERGMPLYVRADAIRQESRSQWRARRVQLANVAFARPHFSIGADDVTITRAPSPGERAATAAPEKTFLDARGVSFRFGETPVVTLPGVRGEVRPSILRELSVGADRGDPVLKTGWDLYAIAGVDPQPGNEATLLLDGYFARGPAAGADIAWKAPDLSGKLFGYYLYDDGTDELPTDDDIEHEDDHRGMIVAEQIWDLDEDWTLFLEGSYISDETFVPALFLSQAETRREFINSAYLRYLAENSGFSIEARGTFNDFLSNQYLLQSRGYTVDKLPEAAYHRVGDDLFGGVLSYSSDYSLSAMRLVFNEPTLEEMGFRTPERARDAFGLNPQDTIGNALRARGLTEDPTYRADTRQEIEAPIRAGPVNINPFIVGRATAWDDNFDEFSGEDNDPYRLWGSAGIRFSTLIQRVDDSVDSPFLDLHRIRHIIEPSATVWTSTTTLHSEDLPVYDEEVESLSTGTAARVGARNTWQTQRGGAGRWASVDWLVIDTNYVWSSEDADVDSPYGRFIEARPEQSNLGEFLANDAVLRLTDALTLTSGVLYDVDNSSLARTTAGFIIDHGYGFSTFTEYRYLDAPSSTFLDLGARYEFTRKYALVLSGIIDTDEGEFQEVNARIERRFPQWTVDLRLGFDNITDEVSAGVAVRPVGLGTERRTRVFTHQPGDRPTTSSLTPQREPLDWGPFRLR